jgi:S-DNA-T family DNA segregation ATPase FtsK/SpoIIIE
MTTHRLSMYTEDSGKASAGDNKENARIIKRTLADFGISVEMDEVTVGPTVTRYALKPAQGVKIEKIMNLSNNIALELGVASVSITRVHEKSLIGIEVPNKQKASLGIGSLLNRKDFLERKDKLTMTFGKDIYGDPVFADMTKMPHLLIAGTTGSGKSVLVHALINSLIYKNSPYDLKFILIDPKKVEFALYGNLPHLYTPVIKDPKKAVQTLNWLVQEMDRRMPY